MKNKKNVLIIILIVILFGVTLFSINLTNKNKNIKNNKEIVLKNTLNITKGGTYNLTGTIKDGYIKVKSNEAVYLVLNNVSITNSKGPAIIIEDAPATTIVLKDGSNNTLVDGNNYNDLTLDGCINAQDDLLIKGNGVLNIKSNFKRGIAAKDNLVIDGGTYKIDAKEEGIKVNDNFDLINGNIDITSGLEGIKVSNKKDLKIGNVKIDNGTIKVKALDKGISARNEIVINNGTIDIETNRSGIKSKNITINNGNININAIENGIAASGTKVFNKTENKYYHENDALLNINNGNIVVLSGKDGVKVNGTGTMNDGYIEIYTNYGLKSSCLDQDIAFNINGGTLLAFGYNNKIKMPNDTSKQKSYIYKFNKTNEPGKLSIMYDNKEIVSTDIKNKYQYMIISDKRIINDSKSIIKIDDVKIN